MKLKASISLHMLQLEKDPECGLLVVDQQYDFEPGGALAVGGGDEIVSPIARLMSKFNLVVATQDTHPRGHISFASSFGGKKPFQTLSLAEVETGKIVSEISKETLVQYLKKIPGETQVLWPDHCVAGTKGWSLNSDLPSERITLTLQKGNRIDCDSYSAFKENDGTKTKLAIWLRERGIKRLVIAGLAGDYCVLWSAQDARSEGFEVIMDPNLTRFVNFPEGSKERALSSLKEIGVSFRTI